MGLLALTSTVGTAFIGYIYPSYATYKVLAGRPGTEPEIESWMFYWAVIGLLGGFENLFEWFFDWLPLYYEAKFLFIIWLVSPGTQGSTFLYKTRIEPFYASNTQAIDQAIASAQTNAIGFVQSSFQALWAFVISRLTTAQGTAMQGQGPAPGQPGNAAQNTMGQAMAGMWQQYGPALLSVGASMFSPRQNKQAAEQAATSQPFPDPNSPLPPRNVPTPSGPTSDQQELRYRSSPAGTPGEGRVTPPPVFPVPQHQY